MRFAFPLNAVTVVSPPPTVFCVEASFARRLKGNDFAQDVQPPVASMHLSWRYRREMRCAPAERRHLDARGWRSPGVVTPLYIPRLLRSSSRWRLRQAAFAAFAAVTFQAATPDRMPCDSGIWEGLAPSASSPLPTAARQGPKLQAPNSKQMGLPAPRLARQESLRVRCVRRGLPLRRIHCAQPARALRVLGGLRSVTP